MGTNAALWPAYLRGLALMGRGDPGDARGEFQKILDHKGVLAPKDFNPVAMTLYPLAQLGRARAAARTGDVDESRKAYEALLALWKDADPDIPSLRAAKREYIGSCQWLSGSRGRATIRTGGSTARNRSAFPLSSLTSRCTGWNEGGVADPAFYSSGGRSSRATRASPERVSAKDGSGRHRARSPMGCTSCE